MKGGICYDVLREREAILGVKALAISQSHSKKISSTGRLGAAVDLHDTKDGKCVGT